MQFTKLIQINADKQSPPGEPVMGNRASLAWAGECVALTPRLPVTHTLIVDRIMRHPASNGSL
jgi:hypothetical protein